MTQEQKKFTYSFIIPLLFIVILWSVKLIEKHFGLNLSIYGVFPRTLEGLKGVFIAPLLHENYDHLFSNSFPLLLLAAGILYFYPQSSYKVFVIIYLLPGILVWFFGRSAYHIGASGIIYGFLAFLFFSGIFRRDNRSIALALIVTFLYGGLIWGVLPLDKAVSWEYHFFGGITGILCAFLFRNFDKYKKYDWEDEEEFPEDNFKKPNIYKINRMIIKSSKFSRC